MAKMYYTEDEAASKLGVSADELSNMVAEGKLKVYADGAKKVYRVEEVDALSGGGEEVELTPAGDEGEGDMVTLSAADEPAKPGKGDTVISSEGISIFDDEDLEVESADPMAKTSIAPSVEDQISLEGVGSGSGLLDLTRESDDTSLGAEVLDHIDSEPATGGTGAAEVPETAYAEPEPTPAPEAPVVVEAPDASSGLFGGLIAAAALVMLVASAVALAAMLGMYPGFISALRENLMIFIGAGVVIGVVLAVVGLMLGKAAAGRAEALQRSGG
jgi:excisionase family DNA binding protein